MSTVIVAGAFWLLLAAITIGGLNLAKWFASRRP
jgi:hypothetical protein